MADKSNARHEEKIIMPVEEKDPGRSIPAFLPGPTPADFSYEIRVRDHLDPCWWDWFEGWSLENIGRDVVLLSRSGVDQSALHGALNKIRDMNLTLISVILVD
ncbi:MAG TPA: hypothetical protein VGK00_12970 [Anaerolineales bacterium]